MQLRDRLAPVRAALGAALLAGLATGCRSAPPESPGPPEPTQPFFVADGIDVFYRTVDLLIRDEEPTQLVWDELFDAPGYAQLDEVENRSASVPGLMELVYRPSRRDELEARRGTDDAVARFVIPNLEIALDVRDEIDDVVRTLEEPEAIEEILANAARYLPEGSVDPADLPTLYLVVIDGDSKAFRSGIVLDVVGLALTGTEYAKRLIAHEFHHHYRRRLDRVAFDDVDEQVLPLVRLMERAETEGIADLIDKRDLVTDPAGLPPSQTAHPLFAWMWDAYLGLHASAPEHLVELNALLEAYGEGRLDAERATTLERQASRISARAFGVFVADAVDQELGRERVASCVGDPFALFLAYAEAAQTRPSLPGFSTLAQDVLRQLQADYAGAPGSGD